MGSWIYTFSLFAYLIPMLEITLMILGIFALIYIIRALKIYIRNHE